MSLVTAKTAVLDDDLRPISKSRTIRRCTRSHERRFAAKRGRALNTVKGMLTESAMHEPLLQLKFIQDLVQDIAELFFLVEVKKRMLQKLFILRNRRRAKKRILQQATTSPANFVSCETCDTECSDTGDTWCREAKGAVSLAIHKSSDWTKSFSG